MTSVPSLKDAPHALFVDDQWQLGVYRTPFADVEMSTKGWKRYRLKEWHYVSFTTDEWFVALGLVQLGYVANLFAYAVDRREGECVAEYGELSPMGRALSFAPSSIAGRTTWRNRNAYASIEADDGWTVELDLPVGAERLSGRARIETRESLAMLHRLGPNRVAYTHKAAGWPASGELTLGGRRIRLDGGLAASDWTRSQANRVTEWKWVSVNGFLEDGTSVGLNLSAQVYEDERGHSVENALFVDGRVRHLSGVRFLVPSSPQSQTWRIASLEGSEVDLEFEPLGAREEHTNLGLMRTDFVQPYGRFTGHVCGLDFTGLFGVVEVHLSVW
jgi:hypothetical protein